MNISQIARQTRLSAKSIRLYEEKGIISPPQRADNGYRVYDQSHVEQLLIVARAKRAGFTLDECASLVALAHNSERTSAEVKQRAQEKLAEVEKKMQELAVMKQQLEQWIAACPGDSGADCPIIDDLTGCNK
jgi:MerR family copper efflux transcriptional regulator